MWLCHHYDLGLHATCINGVWQCPSSGSIIMGIIVDIICGAPLSGSVMVVRARITHNQDTTAVGGSYCL